MNGEGATWHRVHPFSPLLRMWAVLVGVVAVLGVQQAEQLGRLRDLLADSPLPTGLVVLVVIMAIPLAFAVGWVISLPWWRATGYLVDDEEIRVRRGVVSRQLRTARFDRVQAVDLVEPLAPRLFRLAGVKVETAGGSGSAVSVEYLRRADAESLRTTLLHLVHGAPEQADDRRQPEAPTDTPGTADTSSVVPTIPVARSLVAAALSGSTVLVLVGAVVAVSTPAGLAVLVPVALGAVPWFWGVLNASWRFTARLNGDVLGLTFGLTERRRQSVPLARIHAVEVSQPVVWRILGWWKVKVDIAGYGDDSDGDGSTTTVLPVGDLPRALQVLSTLCPLTGEQVATLANPEGISQGRQDGVAYIYRSPTNARWVSPLDRRRQGITLAARVGPEDGTDGPDGTVEPNNLHAVISHHGRFRRVVSVIAPGHVQEVSHRRGPVQKVLGLAEVRLDLVPGPVAMVGRDLTVADSADLVSRLRRRSLPGPAAVNPALHPRPSRQLPS